MTSTLNDATSGIPLLTADNNFVDLAANAGLAGHGLLDKTSGFDPGDGAGPLPTWMALTSTNWFDASWFAFELTAEKMAQHWGFGENEGSNLVITDDFLQWNLFLRPGQTNTTPVFTVWDEDGNATLTINDPDIDGGSDGANVTVWWGTPDHQQHGSLVEIYALPSGGDVTVKGPNGAMMYMDCFTDFAQFILKPSTNQGNDINVVEWQAKDHTTVFFAARADGGLMMQALPTADPHNAGQLWNDSGTVKVSAG